MITPSLGRQEIHVDGASVTIHVDRVTASRRSHWEAEAKLIDGGDAPLAGRIATWPHGTRGIIVRASTDVDVIDVSYTSHQFMPGRSVTTINIRSVE